MLLRRSYETMIYNTHVGGGTKNWKDKLNLKEGLKT